MAIITADIQYKPQQEIVCDISMMQVASKTSKKSSKPAKDKAKTKEEQEIYDYIVRECQYIYTYVASKYSAHGSAAQQAMQEVQQEVTNYLKSLNHPIADQILKEYRAQWKNQ